MLLGPPAHVEPARLFRLLIQRPRPRLPLTWRASAAPHVALYVVALRGVEQEEAHDASKARGGPPDVQQRALWAELAVRSLRTDDGPALGSAAQLDGLPGHEGAALLGALATALATISPTYGWSDWPAWDRALRKGAEHRSNYGEALTMGACADFGAMGGSSPRPDRYYGLPVADITDGQLMAYRAARAVFLDAQKRNA